MKMILCSVGKPHEKIIKDGVEDFTNRLGKYMTVQWQIIATPKNAAVLSETALKRQEAVSIMQFVQNGDYLVLLDERGKQFSSPELAQMMQQRMNESVKRIIFLIGGAFGVDDSIIQRADF